MSNKSLHTIAIASLMVLAFAGCGGPSESALIELARASLAEGDRTAAVVHLKQAIQQVPNNPETRFLLGSSFAQQENWVSAEVELRKARELGYPLEGMAALYAQALLENRQFKKLVDEAAAITLTDVGEARRLALTVATAHAQLKNTAKAQEITARLLAEAPQHAPALLLQARMDLAAGNAALALRTAEGVLARDTMNVDALQIKGEIESYINGDRAAGRRAFEAVLAQRPAHLEANLGLVSTLMAEKNLAQAQRQAQALAKLRPTAPHSQYLLAQVALAMRDLQTARAHVQTLLQVAPNVPEFLLLAGAIEAESGANVKAEAHLSKALAGAPAMPQPRLLLARIQALTDRAPQALSLLAPLLVDNSQEAEAMMLAAEIHQQQGDAKAAEALYNRAARITPEDTRLRTALALSKLTRGQTDAGFAELQQLVGTQDDGVADMALFRARLASNDIPGAIVAIEALEKKQPQQPLASNLRGRIDMLRRDVAGAKRHFERALVIDPGYFPAANSLASLLIVEGKADQAVAVFDALLKAQPRHVQAMLAKAALKARSGAGKDEVVQLISQAISLNPADPAAHVRLIDYLSDQRDYKGAHAAAQAGLVAIADDADILERLARVQLSSGETNQAVASYAKLASLRPSPSALLGLAGAQMAAGNVDGANQTWRRMVDSAGQRPDVQRRAVGAMIQARQQSAALAISREIMRKQPGDAIGALLAGDVEASRGRWAEALALFRQGIGKQGAQQIPMRIHATLLLAKQADEATRFAADWTRSNPRDLAFLLHLADMAAARRDAAGAERAYREALKADAANPRALNNLAWLLLQQRKPGALALAERAVAMLPNDTAVLDTYAVALSDAGQLPKAIEVLVALAAAQPESLQTQVNLAALYLKAGDKSRAAALLKSVQARGSKFENQPEVERLLKQT